MRNEKSDIKFIEWSRGRKLDEWDVVAVSNWLCSSPDAKFGLDIGGGIGTFSGYLVERCKNIEKIEVVDPAETVRTNFIKHERVNLISNSLEEFSPGSEKYDFAIVNLVLHHIIGANELQCNEELTKFLTKIRLVLKSKGTLYVQENIYESMFGNDICGRLIYEITKLKAIQKVVRKLGANTAGEGVRFHSDHVWLNIFSDLGFEVYDTKVDLTFGQNMPLWQKFFLLCSGRYQKIYVMRKKT